jgi:hypothetical protein
VIVECTERLIPIVKRTWGVDCYPSEKAVLEAGVKADAYIPMGSLPWVFKQYEPLEQKGYLKPDPERVAYWKAKYPGLKVGVSWRGGTPKTHEHFRNFHLKHWFPLFENEATFISVQYGDWEYERIQTPMLQPECQSFDDHIALVAACDLIISVCNTTVHEAGATNTPCWVLVPDKAAWRYSLVGDRMFFYPSVQFYRQQNKEWSDVVKSISADLGRLRQAERRVA